MRRILFIILSLVFINQINAQVQPNDCVNAIIVCGNENFISNATGIGNKQEVAGCGGFEHNSIWLKINIAQGGKLGFNIIPNDPSILVDYDFWVYAANKTCNALGSPIRCATTNPNLAGMSNNHTGIDGSTTSTTVGPGANGLGYVQWLTVTAGQFYYICIDRPVGDGGFELQWTGTAMAGTGAFPSSPTANSISDYIACSSTPNIGIFDLNSVRTQINPDTTLNTISFFSSYANAIDNINTLPDIYSNTSNPQTIYTRVTDNLSGCFTLTDFKLVVSDLPTATMSVSSNTICLGNSVAVTFSGTPKATIEYTINGGSVQTAILDAAGNFVLSDSPIVQTIYKLTKVQVLDSGGNPICTDFLNDPETVSIVDLPTATISGTTTICSETTADITFTGTPNATISYTVDTASATVVLDATGTAIVTTPILTTNSEYVLVDVTSSGTPACSQLQTGNVQITVNPLPTVSISGTTTICSGATTEITFTGTPNATVNYNIDSGVNQIIVLDAAGNAKVTTTALTTNTTYNLVSVISADIPSCTQNISGSAVITVNAPPTVTISGTTTICVGNTTIISFSGTPNATVEYTVDSATSTLILDASGNATITTPTLTSNSTYQLVGVTSSGSPICSQPQTGSAVVTVIPSPTVTISGTTTICSGTTTDITFNGTPNATVNYTVDAKNATLILDASGNATVTTPILITNSIYELVSVSETVAPFCSQPQTGTAVITVNPLPTVSISGTTTICPGTSTVITFNGTPSATVNYTIDTVNASTILDASGNATVTTPLLTSNSIYSLVSVDSSGTPICSKAQSGSATITVKPYAVITATPPTESICSGINTNIVLASSNSATTFTWTANATNVTGSSNGSGKLISQNLSAIGNSSGVVIYTIKAITNGCDELPLEVTVNVSPQPTAIANVVKSTICSGETSNILLTSNITGTTFSWTATQTNVTGATSGNGSSIQQVLTATGSTQGTVIYTITPNNNGCIGMPITETITVIPAPIVTANSATNICSGEFTNITLSSSLSGTTYTWTVIQNGVSGATNGSGDSIIQSLTLTGSSIGTATYSILPTVNGCDGKIVKVTITVNPLPVSNLQDGALCVDLNGLPVQTYTLDTGLNNTNHNFEWFYQGNSISGAINSTYIATQSGTYSVIATNSTTGCKSPIDTATVGESIPGKTMALTQTELFSDNSSIYVTVEGGNGTYLYQLDNGYFQESNTFNNVSPGQHVVNVKDTNGCTNLSEKIFIVGYPKYFTPNGDGYNDTWNIIELNTIIYTKISIFDRYGKLIIQLKPNSNGWDGTYNGKNLPSTDYWFSFDYKDDTVDKVFRSHFALKR